MTSKTSENKGTRISTKFEDEFEIQQSIARVLLGIIALAIFMIFILAKKAVFF